MRRVHGWMWLSLALFLALPFACQNGGQGGAAAGPKLQIVQPDFDAGDVNRDEKVTHTFILKNVGKDVLHIKRAQGS